MAGLNFNTVKGYIAITKLKLVALLFFTGFTSVLIASTIYGFDWAEISMISVAIILSVMGSNATTAYIDREMDKIMNRTSARPVPSGTINPPVNALIFGIALVIAGIILAAFTSYYAAVFIFLGFIDSAIIYNALLKKRSPMNILYGSPAGGMPVLAGWIAVSNTRLNLIAILMFLLVIIWTPMHIWSLAYFYSDDYKKAGVPMLTSIWSPRRAFLLIGGLNILLVFLSVFIGALFKLSMLYVIISAALGAVVLALSIILIINNKKRTAWALFKFSSPYLAVIFLLLLAEYLWI
ncbi:MAG: Protoheme IX farnesyltransferase [Actinobacteria bacterium ADurb.Bin346]|nr:MAG: Protoheme IX farnesyltransferase [Actinobacteria bacterium ADurb.Bin346]